MKVVFVSAYYSDSASGANKRFLNLVKCTSNILKEDLIVVTCKNNPVKIKDSKFKEKFIPFDVFNGKIGRLLVTLWLNLYFLYCASKGYKVISDFNPVPISQFFSKNQFQLIHDARLFDEFGRWGGVSKALMKFQWGNLKNIVTVSRFSKNCLLTNLKLSKDSIIVSYNGLSEEYFDNINSAGNAICPISNRKIDLLYVATFERRKNHEALINSLEYLNNPLNIVFLGKDNGYKTEVLKMISNLKKIHNIEIIDNVTETELLNFYKSTKVFVNPSLYEGFGMPLIEAQTQGANICCSDIDVFREIMLDDAIYFDPLSPKRIAESITVSLQPHDQAKKINFDVNKFKWQNIANKLLNDLSNRASR